MQQTANFILQDCTVANPANGTLRKCNLIIRNGIILPENANVALPKIDAKNWLITPGLWDVHVHFRDPGNPQAETKHSGAEAAARGGFTHVVTMPNTTPAGDNAEWIKEQIETKALPVKIHPAACVTAGRLGKELSNMSELAQAGAAAFSDDGNMVADENIMRQAMKEAKHFNKPIMQHAVFPNIAKGGVIRDVPLAKELNLKVFPPEAEIEAVRRDITICRETGCKLDIQHISCAQTVELIRQAKKEGLPVTGEASPHHIFFSAEEIPCDDANWKMNPPLGKKEDVYAIRDGVLDGTLSIFATDHAPHTAENKAKGFALAPFGVIGLETAVAVTWQTMVTEEGMDILEWVKHWTVNPANLLDLPSSTIEPGVFADICAIDLSHNWTVEPEKFSSLSKNTPFAGKKFSVKPVLTILEGLVTFQDAVL